MYPEWAQYILIFGPLLLAVLSWAWVVERKFLGKRKDDDDKRNK